VNVLELKGLPVVLGKLTRAKGMIGGNVERGMVMGGQFLQRCSQQVVPVLTGNLKGSADTRNVGGKGFDVDVVVSYGAEYAIYVHENVFARHKSGKQAKFLEQPARERRGEIIQIVKQFAELGQKGILPPPK